jgi:hypothetical protein
MSAGAAAAGASSEATASAAAPNGHQDDEGVVAAAVAVVEVTVVAAVAGYTGGLPRDELERAKAEGLRADDICSSSRAFSSRGHTSACTLPDATTLAWPPSPRSKLALRAPLRAEPDGLREERRRVEEPLAESLPGRERAEEHWPSSRADSRADAAASAM